MEQSPQDNQNEHERPALYIDLTGPQGNVYRVIGLAGDKQAEQAFEATRQLFVEAIGSGVEPTQETLDATAARIAAIGKSTIRLALELHSAMQPGSSKKYPDMLAIINKYTRLVDTSDTYPQYSVESPADGKADGTTTPE